MLKTIYKLKTNIHHSKSKTYLKKRIQVFLSNHDFILSNIFWKNKKKVFIKKWEEININEKKRYKLNRLRCFFCWIELIKIADKFYKNDKNQFELNWITPDWDTIMVHLRKEKNLKKDSYIFYVSSYFKSKK